MSFTEHTCQLDDGLHALDLSLDDNVEIFLLDFGERQEVNGSCIAGGGIFRNKWPKRLVDVLRQERRVRRLHDC